MTPDDKRRLAEIRKGCRLYKEDECSKSSVIGVALFLLRLLDEATAERDIAMARCQRSAEEYAHLASRSLAREDAAIEALREWNDARKEIVSGQTKSTARYVRAECGIESLLAAHSAATKPTEEVSG